MWKDYLGGSIKGALNNSRHQAVGDMIQHNGFDALLRQLDAISQEDFLFQSMLIKQALFASIHSSTKEESCIKVQGKEVKHTDDIKKVCLDKASEILDSIKTLAFVDNDIPYWGYLSPVDPKHWSANLGTFDLYNGILGIVLSYATAAVLTDNTHYRNLVLHFTEKLEPILNTLNDRSSVGAYSGLGAFLIFITRLNQLGLINTSQARQLTEKITTHFDKIFKEDYPIFDVIDGTAGYLLALIISRSLINQDSLDSQLKRCVKHIMTLYPNPHVMPENDGNRRHHGKTILGFAHGMMGVVYALEHYARISGDTLVIPWVQQAYQHHQCSWIDSQHNWPDVIESAKNTTRIDLHESQ